LEKQAVIDGNVFTMSAKLVEKLPDAYVVELKWEPADLAFAEIIEKMGDTPLPPYIKRKAEETDKERYQTVYAKYDGSVAAPTAGLHFTPAIFEEFEQKGINSTYVTLHVGAGTFKPVKATAMADHEMHAEWIEVKAGTIQSIINNHGNGIIAVGTTSVRTLESLYWMGVKTILFPAIAIEDLAIKQWEVYDDPLVNSNTPVQTALAALLEWMHTNNCIQLFTSTQILLAPGYQYKIPSAIITNFHQPQSTLLLLVAAAIGNDWKKIYEYAMDKDFRFLSYGDGSLLFLPATGN
jgi:S-adenosylmethionine:tRNA ribosyltransferase-isomerase